MCPVPVQLPLMAVDLDSLVPVPGLTTALKSGFGLAVCRTLGLLVASTEKDNALHVFVLPSSLYQEPRDGAGAGSGLVPVCALGGTSSPAPMLNGAGNMAFTGPASCRLLLVPDIGNGAVHVVDVLAQVHVGYVAAPGTTAGPRCVAVWDSLAAVSDSAADTVHVFEGSGASWSPVRVVAGGCRVPGRAPGQLSNPRGLRFTRDGEGLVVADMYNNRVSMFRVEDGSFVQHVATGLSRPYDVEECSGPAGGWLRAMGASSL